jgi:hypothetical protein
MSDGSLLIDSDGSRVPNGPDSGLGWRVGAETLESAAVDDESWLGGWDSSPLGIIAAH